MIRLAGSLLATALLLTATAASAQQISEPVSEAVVARLSAMPNQLAGLTRSDSDSYDGRSSRAMFAYRGVAATDPVITVVFSDVTKPVTLRSAAQLGRGEAARAGLIETLFEGKFSVPGHPGATTYFGDFLTHQGIKQSWIAEYGGVRTTISVTLYRAEDRRAVFDAIRTHLLGGAEMTAKASPAELN